MSKRIKHKKESIRRKQLKKELSYITIFAGLILISVWYSYSSISIDLINIVLEHSERMDLLFNLFTVQATIAALSISIIAIITGFQTESVYGVSITNYVTSLKPYFFKHKNLMIADLIITAINYILVSFEMYNTSVMVFIISIIISCIMINDTAFIFKSHSRIVDEIGKYIKENISSDYLKELENSIFKSAALENISTLEESLNLLCEVFQQELNKEQHSELLLKQMEKTIEKLFIKSYLSTNKEMVLSILHSVNRVYDIANDTRNKHSYPVDIWSSIYIEYTTFIGTVSVLQLNNRNKFDFIELKWQMQKNQVYENVNGVKKAKNNINLEYYYTWMYTYIVLKNNNALEKEDYSRIKERIIDDAYTDAFYYQGDSLKKYNNTIGLCYLLKTLIENGEIELISSKYLMHERYGKRSNSNAFVYFVCVIYAYYLSFREPLVKDKKEQSYAKEFLKECVKKNNFFNRVYYIDLIDFLNEYFIKIYDLLQNWEKFENGIAKTICLEPTISEFLFFVSIEKYFDEAQLAECFRLISRDNAASLMLRYFNSDDSFPSQYNSFHKNIFSHELEEQRLTTTENLVKGALSREHKHEMVEDAKKKCIDSKKINSYKEKLNLVFKNQIEKLKVFDNNELMDNNVQTTKMNLSLLLDEMDFAQQEIDQYTSNFIFSNIVYMLFYSLRNYIEIQQIDYDNKNKQSTLISLANNITPDTFVGSRETFWDEEDKDLLIRYTEKMNKIENPYDINSLYLFNSSLTYFSISNVHYEFCDCTEADFDDLNVDRIDDKYYYCRSSNLLKSSFTKEELLDYLHMTRKQLIITADIKYAAKSKVVGCGIEITYDDLDNNDNEEV